ncbi:MAG: M14 family zinc carboxypeptidase [Solirubrobacteraceae bacterium]
MNRPILALAALVAAGIPASAHAATPTPLPTITRTLTADQAVKRSCLSVPATARRGVAISSYTTPMSGYVTARLSGAKAADWDLVAIDRASGTRMGSSQSFGSNEVVQAWTSARQQIAFVACRRSGSARTAKLAISFFDAVRPAHGPRVSVIRVFAGRDKLAGLDAAGLDVTESQGPGWADVLVAGADQLKVITAAGLRHVVRVADLDASVARSARATVRAGGPTVPSGRTAYRTYEEVQADLKKLADEHPTTVRPIVIGKTFQGRDIQGLEIAKDVKASDGRPTFFLMGAHHAREWPSEEIAMEYATLLANPGSDARVNRLLASERTVIVPVVNVDGFVSTRGLAQVDPYDNVLASQDETINGVSPISGDTAEAVAPPGGILAYRRKNCDGAVPNGAFPCELQWGVDNNRNYGNLWGGPGSSQDPTSQSFHGPAPRSEPETQAVWNFARTHQVTGLISLHTIAALVLRPPGLHDGGLSPDEQAMKVLGDKMADATGYTSQYSFQLYDTAGTTEDDTYAATGGYGYTIEIGPAGGTFHGDYSKYVIGQWNKGDVNGKTGMREALLLMGESVADPAQHAVLQGSAPAGAKLTLTRDFETATSPYCDLGVDPVLNVGSLPDALACPAGINDPQKLKDKLDSSTVVPADGRFSWHVNQSTRPFVGGGAVIRELSKTPTREQSYTSDGPGSQNEDREFVLAPGENPESIKIDLTWPTPEDYDLEVYKKAADGSVPATPLASSGSTPGTPEQVILSGDQISAGTYVLRVVAFLGASGTWDLKVGTYDVTEKVTTGHREAYTLSCAVGGKVVKTTQVTIDRGQTLDVNPCSTATPPAVQAITGGSSGSPSSPAAPANPAVTPAAGGKAKVTKAQLRKAKKACTSAKKAAKGKHGKQKAKAKARAKAACAKAAKVAKRYRAQQQSKA